MLFESNNDYISLKLPFTELCNKWWNETKLSSAVGYYQVLPFFKSYSWCHKTSLYYCSNMKSSNFGLFRAISPVIPTTQIIARPPKCLTMALCKAILKIQPFFFNPSLTVKLARFRYQFCWSSSYWCSY